MATDLQDYKVDLNTPQPNGRSGESPRAAFTKYNDALDAIEDAVNQPAPGGEFISNTEPTTPSAYMVWIDTSTTPAHRKRRNGANDAWVDYGPVDQIPLTKEGNLAGIADVAAARTNLGAASQADLGALSTDVDNANANIAAISRTASATGTGNAIEATFTPPVTEADLVNGARFLVRASAANEAGTVTFNPDVTGPLELVKGSDTPLEVGDIAGAGQWMEIRYDFALDKFVLLNPMVTGGGSGGGTVPFFKHPYVTTETLVIGDGERAVSAGWKVDGAGSITVTGDGRLVAV